MWLGNGLAGTACQSRLPRMSSEMPMRSYRTRFPAIGSGNVPSSWQSRLTDRHAVLGRRCRLEQHDAVLLGATDRSPGPKYTGPQAQRFRAVASTDDRSPSLCSGCGICTDVCPNGVAVTDIITIAKAAMVENGAELPFRQKLLNRPDALGKICATLPAVANYVLSNGLLRMLADNLIGIHRSAPLPRTTGRKFRRWLRKHEQPPRGTATRRPR